MNNTAATTTNPTTKRADELKLGDRFLVRDTFDADVFKAVEVWSLQRVGDDVEVNGFLTTSQSNTVVTV